MQFFGMAASLRKESYNKKLLDLCVSILRESGVQTQTEAFSKFDSPSFDDDMEKTKGQPASVLEFVKHIQSADGLIFASPEYNYSMPGAFKNILDWVSRIKPNPLFSKPCLLISASTAEAGGHRGLIQLRVPLEGVGTILYPEMFCLSGVHQAFNPDLTWVKPDLEKRLRGILKNYSEFVSKLNAK